MKIIIVTAFLFICICTNAQKDSLKKITFSAIQLELNGTNTFIQQSIKQNHLQSFIKDDTLLNKKFPASNNGYWYNGNSVSLNGTVAGKVYFSIPSTKKLKKDIYIGLLFNNNVATTTGYANSQIDTLGIYTNFNNNLKFELQEKSYSYMFSINNSQILIPIGLNFNTNKLRRFWFNFGLEFAPGITFNYKYTSGYFSNTSTFFVEPLTPSSDYYKSQSFNSSNNGYKQVYQSKLKGIGFACYLAVPLTANMRISKHIKYLKHLNVLGSIAPGIYLQQNKYTKNFTNYTNNIVLGLRYNL